MNNKYLAIVLAVVAVIVVFYQIFLRKPTENIQKKINQPVQQPPSLYTPKSKRIDTPIKKASTVKRTLNQRPISDFRSSISKEKTIQKTEESGLIIDYNSEILLERIQAEMATPNAKRELDDVFGKQIFSRGRPKGTIPSTPVYEREVEFVLNAIIIDEERRIAIINDEILGVGDVILGARVESIVKSRVVLKLGGRVVALSTNSRVKRIKLLGNLESD